MSDRDTKASTTHTPGPWRLTDDHRTRRVIRGGNPERTVCIIESWTTDPDADLIAAAPELLAACELTMTLLSDLTTEQFAQGADRPARVKLEEAIAKARGGAS